MIHFRKGACLPQQSLVALQYSREQILAMKKNIYTDNRYYLMSLQNLLYSENHYVEQQSTLMQPTIPSNILSH